MARQQQAHALHHPRLVQAPLMALPQRRHEAEGSRGGGRAGAGWFNGASRAALSRCPGWMAAQAGQHHN